ATGTNGNIAAAPTFVNRASGNFRLTSGSPGIDVGDNNDSNLPSLDFDKTPRILPIGTTVDMGAFEFSTPTTATVSTLSLTFADQTAGTASTARDVTVTKTGPSTLVVNSLSITGQFAQTNTCQTTNGIAAGLSCTFSVVFSPTAGGPRSGHLIIGTNAGISDINLSG